MSYGEYVLAAYAVFAIVLAWDFVAPRLRIARQLRAAKQQAARRAPRAAATGELRR